ncbi:hypothetical protein V5799_033671 [Amblyomma americanum]|uniref:Uncharacterized protein n=1 Tax=Amblyomma americanum TaxID=6943 RepID=A0AAQ4DMM8_AMBAM
MKITVKEVDTEDEVVHDSSTELERWSRFARRKPVPIAPVIGCGIAGDLKQVCGMGNASSDGVRLKSTDNKGSRRIPLVM